jgi:hypothetical protein
VQRYDLISKIQRKIFFFHITNRFLRSFLYYVPYVTLAVMDTLVL